MHYTNLNQRYTHLKSEGLNVTIPKTESSWLVRCTELIGTGSRNKHKFTFVQFLPQFQGLLVRRTTVIDFVQIQRAVLGCLLLQGTGASFHQQWSWTRGDVELRAQAKTEYCNWEIIYTYNDRPCIRIPESIRFRSNENKKKKKRLLFNVSSTSSGAGMSTYLRYLKYSTSDKF